MCEEISKAREVKQEYEEEWLLLEEVTAVGIGKTFTGGVGIIISVKELSDRIREEIPSEIADVPIEVRESGEMRAL